MLILGPLKGIELDISSAINSVFILKEYGSDICSFNYKVEFTP